MKVYSSLHSLALSLLNRNDTIGYLHIIYESR
jgi:hypothetical protein